VYLSRFDIMIKVPEALQKKYNLLLMNSEVSPGQYAYCQIQDYQGIREPAGSVAGGLLALLRSVGYNFRNPRYLKQNNFTTGLPKYRRMEEKSIRGTLWF